MIILDPKKVQVGHFCAARFPTGTLYIWYHRRQSQKLLTNFNSANGGDDYFYRAEILAVQYQSRFVDVRYIDYGNTAHISTDNLIDLPKSLTKLAPQAIHCRLPLTKEVFMRNRMYQALTSYQERCNSGDHLGMEIYEIPTHAKQPAKVNLIINNVPLLTRKDSKPKSGPVQLYQKKLSVKCTYKFTIIEGTDFYTTSLP